MREDLYSQKLAWFKQSERPEAVLLVADSPERISGKQCHSLENKVKR